MIHSIGTQGVPKNRTQVEEIKKFLYKNGQREFWD